MGLKGPLAVLWPWSGFTRKRTHRSRTDTPHNIAFYCRIFSYFREDTRLIVYLIALIWISLIAGVLEGATVGALTDAVVTSLPRIELPSGKLLRILGGVDRASSLLLLALLWLALRLTNDSVQLLREMINHRLRYNGTARVRTRLYEHVQSLSPAFHKSRPQGDVIYRLSMDAQGFFGVLDTFIGAANSAVTVIVIGVVMAGFNQTIAAVCLCLAPLLLIANAHFGRTIRRTSADSKQADTELTTFIQRAVASIGLVQLFGREKAEAKRFGQAVARTTDLGMRMSWQQQLYPMVQRMTYAFGHAFVLGYGGYLVYEGHWVAAKGAVLNPAASFTVGGITAMLVYLGQLWEPVRRMAGFTADAQNNVAACARVFEVLDLEPTVKDSPHARPLMVRPRVLELREVEFGYVDDRPVLCGIDAVIEPGEMVAFVGPSGTGKSTLLNLLPRFYDPTAGSLMLDDVNLRDIRLSDVRSHIALVPQDSPVIAGTIADNIAFGNTLATDEGIREAAELAGAAHFIDQLPDGYNTQVTENGQNLSGGQRQRLAIARALLTEAPILVLDEPTSGLDARHERLVLDTLEQLRGRRTIILVTHHLPAVANCDRIFVLHGGQVAESGTHEQLLARRGVYAAMASEPASTPSTSQSGAA